MSCQEKFETISAYLDGELTGAELKAFREHLGGCSDCRRELAEQERMWGLLGEVKVQAGSPALTRRILGATTAKRAKVGSVGRTLGWLVPLAAAASLLIAVVIWQPAKMDSETVAVIQNLNVLEHLDVLENLDLLQEAQREPLIIENPDAAQTVLEEGSSS